MMKKFSKIVMAMRRASLFAALVVAMTAVSCVKEMNVENHENPTDAPVTFEASFGAVSKAVLEAGESESKVAWEEADQVSVLVGEGNYLYVAKDAGYTTTLLTEATGVPTQGTYYAVYPYDEDAILEGNVITTSLPATQAAVLNSFSSHLSVSQAVDSQFSFKNVCGLVRVNVASDNVTKVTFAGNNEETVAGAIKVTVSGTPAWEAVDGVTTLELVPADGATTLARGDYYLAVLPQTFEKGITVTAYKGEDAWDVRKTSTSLTIKRSDMKNSNPFGVVGSGTEADPYLLDSPQDLVEMRDLAILGGETWFKMIKDIDMKDVTNYVPVNYDQYYERKIHFDGGNHTISNFASSHNGYPSLFGVLYGSVKDLKVVNATIDSKGHVAGIIGGYVGTTNKPAEVTNVYVQGTVKSTIGRCGGFAGNVVGAKFTDCSADVTVEGLQATAGFVGKAQGDVSFTNCKVKAIVKSSATEKHQTSGFVGYLVATKAQFTSCEVLEGTEIIDNSGNSASKLSSIGGFIGWAGTTDGLEITDCHVNVKITAPFAQNVSGMIAVMGKDGNYSNGNLTISKCSVAGNVVGNNQVAGVLAFLESGNKAKVTISNTNSSVDVKGTGHYVGVFAGNVGNAAGNPVYVTDCYATGNVLGGNSSCSAFIACVNADLKMVRCYATGTVSEVRGNIGGLVGNAASGTVSIEDSYFAGSLNTTSGPSAGIIGYCAANTTITDSYVKGGSIKGGAGQIAGLVGRVVKSLTIKDCYAELDITASGNPSGGLVGLVDGKVNDNTIYDAILDLTDSHYKGKLSGNAYVGGAVGQINTSCTHCHISRVYTEGTFTASGNYSGCLVGAAMGSDQKITDCWSSADLTGKGQQVGGVVGAVTASITVGNCYTSGDIVTNTSGAAGILGRVQKSSTVTNCIAWNKYITCNRTSNGVYAPGAILGCAQEAGTYSGCWRRADMVFTDPYMVLSDQEDFINAMPPLPSYSTATHQQAYHGKAAAADATISSVAQSIGWSSEIWDFSGAVPTLK